MIVQVIPTTEEKESKSRVKSTLGAIGTALAAYYGLRY
jgi:hypothetical protein